MIVDRDGSVVPLLMPAEVLVRLAMDDIDDNLSVDGSRYPIEVHRRNRAHRLPRDRPPGASQRITLLSHRVRTKDFVIEDRDYGLER